jgi:hypothetical protein
MNQNTFAAKFEILNKNKKPKGQHYTGRRITKQQKINENNNTTK